MKKQNNQKVQSAIAITLFSILIISGGCSKNTNKPSTGSTKIIYTDVKPDSVITTVYNLDLDNDGTADFEFDRAYIVACNDEILGTYGSIIALTLEPASAGNAIMADGSNLPLALDSSAIIAPDSIWATIPSQVLLEGGVNATSRCTTLPAIRGNWLHVSDKYVGLKFNKGNNTYYGWARLSSSYSVITTPPYVHLVLGQLVLKDYAYNSIPNQPILAGQAK